MGLETSCDNFCENGLRYIMHVQETKCMTFDTKVIFGRECSAQSADFHFNSTNNALLISTSGGGECLKLDSQNFILTSVTSECMSFQQNFV